jgi:hypothetical protein
MKTIREWLETLPDGYRERALANLKKDGPANSLYGALETGFQWIDTTEGFDFWCDLSVWARNKAQDHTPRYLPNLPEE